MSQSTNSNTQAVEHPNENGELVVKTEIKPHLPAVNNPNIQMNACTANNHQKQNQQQQPQQQEGLVRANPPQEAQAPNFLTNMLQSRNACDRAKTAIGLELARASMRRMQRMSPYPNFKSNYPISSSTAASFLTSTKCVEMQACKIFRKDLVTEVTAKLARDTGKRPETLEELCDEILKHKGVKSKSSDGSLSNEANEDSVESQASNIFYRDLVVIATLGVIKKTGKRPETLEELCDVILRGEGIKSKILSSPSNCSTNEEAKEELFCQVCHMDRTNMVFVPCRHMATCQNCAQHFSECPMCRTKINKKIKV